MNIKKKSILAFALLIGMTSSVSAQKFAFVDTDYILNQLPEYRSAQKKLDEISAQWQKELEVLYADVDDLYKEYQAKKVLMTNGQQKEMQEQIIAKEKEAKKFENDKFGFEGDLFKEREKLIKPIQDKVFEAIQTIAKREAIDIMFDKAGGATMLFSNAKYDKSDEVLEELGVVADKDVPGSNNLPPGGNSGDLPPR